VIESDFKMGDILYINYRNKEYYAFITNMSLNALNHYDPTIPVMRLLGGPSNQRRLTAIKISDIKENISLMIREISKL